MLLDQLLKLKTVIAMVPAYTSRTTFVFKPRHPPQSGVVVVRSDAHNHFETLSDLQAFVA